MQRVQIEIIRWTLCLSGEGRQQAQTPNPESGPLRAVHLSRHEWPRGLANLSTLKQLANSGSETRPWPGRLQNNSPAAGRQGALNYHLYVRICRIIVYTYLYIRYLYIGVLFMYTCLPNLPPRAGSGQEAATARSSGKVEG